MRKLSKEEKKSAVIQVVMDQATLKMIDDERLKRIIGGCMDQGIVSRSAIAREAILTIYGDKA